jgi:hypothetical protein
MDNTDRPRLVFHGAIVLLMGLLSGLPTVVESINESGRFWHTFSVALVIGGAVGANAFEPGGTPATFTAFVAAVVAIGGAFVATALTVMGARAALKAMKDGSPLN